MLVGFAACSGTSANARASNRDHRAWYSGLGLADSRIELWGLTYSSKAKERTLAFSSAIPRRGRSASFRGTKRSPSFRVEYSRREHGAIRQFLVQVAGFLAVDHAFPCIAGCEERPVDLESQIDEPNRLERASPFGKGWLEGGPTVGIRKAKG